MKIIVKDLPVKGEIKVGDKVQHDIGVSECETEEQSQYYNEKGYKKLKLFAVTQDRFEIGDCVYHKRGYWGEVVDSNYNDQPEVEVKWKEERERKFTCSRTSVRYLLNVLGEIHSDITWVKDGEEIEVQSFDNEITLYDDRMYGTTSKVYGKSEYKYVRVRCPKCGIHH